MRCCDDDNLDCHLEYENVYVNLFLKQHYKKLNRNARHARTKDYCFQFLCMLMNFEWKIEFLCLEKKCQEQNGEMY